MNEKKEELNDEELNAVTGGSVIETEEPYISQPNEEAQWEARTYTIGQDGKRVESVLKISNPQQAGELKILKFKMKDGETG